MKAQLIIFLKCILTGIIYAFVTCIVQVLIANALFLSWAWLWHYSFTLMGICLSLQKMETRDEVCNICVLI